MKQNKGHILWADDEIDHLRSHILFLEDKGYKVTPVTNAEDAISLIPENDFDLVLLDEMMPGMDGLQALSHIKDHAPALPVIMITKSEEEDLMEEAIGSKIDDYLTKPVNPSQILLSCKKILERKRISGEKITRDYISEFQTITQALGQPMTPDEWIDIHIKLSERAVDLDSHPDLGLRQTLEDQRHECNHAFGRYINEEYVHWVQGKERPVLSVDIMDRYVIPRLNEHENVLFILIDNLRLDQWLVMEPLVYDLFNVTRQHYFSILPTATPYSRNAIFAGAFPADIERRHPELWKQGDDDESSLNRFEHALLIDQLQRKSVDIKSDPRYVKILDAEEAKVILKNIDNYLTMPLTALVFNFVDILAHRRSNSQIIKEMVPDESAYRNLTRTWFEHSVLLQILRAARDAGVKVVLTTDHGSVRAMHGSTVHGDRETSTNLRYKFGRGIRGDAKHVLEIRHPAEYGLPQRGININYLIGREDYYFVYPTNYHRYLALYKDSFQHGGISLEEMVLPVVCLDPKN